MNKEEWSKAFEQIPTGNIADAMDDMGVPRQVIVGLFPLDRKQRIAGWAYTIQQHRRRPDTEKKNLTRQLEVSDVLAEPGDIVVMANNGRMDVCTGGSILALRAKVRGVKGFVVDGCLRDADELEEMQFPTFVKGFNPIRSKGDLETYALQVPVEICGVQVRPGDMIVADATGIMAIPPSIMEEVYNRAKIIFDKEARDFEAIRKGIGIVEFRTGGKGNA